MPGHGSTGSSLSVDGGARHYRRVRRSAPKRRFRLSAPVMLLGVGAAILTCVAGFTLGSLVLGGFASAPPQSVAQGIPNAPPGVSFVLAEAILVNGTSIPATGACATSNLGNLSVPTALVSGTSTAMCANTFAGGYGSGDVVYTLEASWNATAANATIFKVQVNFVVTPATNDVSITSYVKTSASIASPEQAIYSLDLTKAGDTAENSYTMLVTEL